METEFYFVAKWKAGQLIDGHIDVDAAVASAGLEATKSDKCLTIVTHDQKYHAYIIDQDQYDNFCEWVCYEWIDSFHDDYMSVDDALHLHDIQIRRTNLEKRGWRDDKIT